MVVKGLKKNTYDIEDFFILDLKKIVTKTAIEVNVSVEKHTFCTRRSDNIHDGLQRCPSKAKSYFKIAFSESFVTCGIFCRVK